jgi:hypothetical protein
MKNVLILIVCLYSIAFCGMGFPRYFDKWDSTGAVTQTSSIKNSFIFNRNTQDVIGGNGGTINGTTYSYTNNGIKLEAQSYITLANTITLEGTFTVNICAKIDTLVKNNTNTYNYFCGAYTTDYDYLAIYTRPNTDTVFRMSTRYGSATVDLKLSGIDFTQFNTYTLTSVDANTLNLYVNGTLIGAFATNPVYAYTLVFSKIRAGGASGAEAGFLKGEIKYFTVFDDAFNGTRVSAYNSTPFAAYDSTLFNLTIPVWGQSNSRGTGNGTATAINNWALMRRDGVVKRLKDPWASLEAASNYTSIGPNLSNKILSAYDSVGLLFVNSAIGSVGLTAPLDGNMWSDTSCTMYKSASNVIIDSIADTPQILIYWGNESDANINRDSTVFHDSLVNFLKKTRAKLRNPYLHFLFVLPWWDGTSNEKYRGAMRAVIRNDSGSYIINDAYPYTRVDGVHYATETYNTIGDSCGQWIINNKFTLYPIVTTATRRNVKLTGNDTIELRGKYFYPTNSGPAKVKLGDSTATVLSWNDTLIKIRTTAYPTVGDVPLSVTNLSGYTLQNGTVKYGSFTDTLSCGATGTYKAKPTEGYRFNSVAVTSGTATATRLTDTTFSVSQESADAVCVVYFSEILGPTITQQPARDTVLAGTTAEFSVSATGTGTLAYQWQRKRQAGAFGNVGTNSNTYSFVATVADNFDSVKVSITDDNGTTTSNTVACVVLQLPAFNYAVNPATYTYGTAITANTVSRSVAVDSFTGSVPSGLTLNKTTGSITGTPSEVWDHVYRITAYNGSGTGYVDLSITVNPMLPAFEYGLAKACSTGVNRTWSFSPTITGGGCTFSAASLPAGLTIDSYTGVISGSCSVTSNKTGYAVVGTNATGSATDYCTLTVYLGKPDFTYVSNPAYIDTATMRRDSTISIGGYISGWSSDPLPAGLSLDAATGAIYGNPVDTTHWTGNVTATNASGSHVEAFSIVITHTAKNVDYSGFLLGIGVALVGVGSFAGQRLMGKKGLRR